MALIEGFSFAELTRMVQVAQFLPEQEIVVTLSQQLRRSHLHALLPIKDPPPGARLLRRDVPVGTVGRAIE